MHKNNWLVTESKKENLVFLEKSISSGNPLVVIWFQGRGVLHIPEDERADPNDKMNSQFYLDFNVVF